MRATSETLAPGSSDAATSRSFSSCDHRRRRSTDVMTSAREIVIALLLGLPLGPAALASIKQDGPQRRDTLRPFPPEVLEACYNAANGIYADLSKSNPHFNKMYASLSAFRADSLAWNQVAELSYDSFMMRMRTRT